MSIGSRIKQRREELGITQTELAEMLGVTKGAVGNYETDANSPKASILYKVFDVLQCDANFIFQDEKNEIQSAENGGLSKIEADFFNEFRKIPDSHKGLAASLCTALVRELVKHQKVEIATEVSVPAGLSR